jgi:hypothetical protein
MGGSYKNEKFLFSIYFNGRLTLELLNLNNKNLEIL